MVHHSSEVVEEVEVERELFFFGTTCLDSQNHTHRMKLEEERSRIEAVVEDSYYVAFRTAVDSMGTILVVEMV